MEAFLIVLVSTAVVVSGNNLSALWLAGDNCLLLNNISLRSQVDNLTARALPQLAAFQAGTEPTGFFAFERPELELFCENAKGYANCYSPAYAIENRTVYLNLKKQETMAKDIVCDENIRNALYCMTDREKRPTEECNTQCRSATDSFRAALRTRTHEPQSANNLLTTGCAHYNCRVRCNKEKIIERCGGAAALEAVKKTLQAIRDYMRTVAKSQHRIEHAACPDDQLLAGL